MRILFLGLALFLANLTLASADEVNDLLTRHLYAGTLADGQHELLGLVQSNDKSKAAQASAALGIVKFVISIEKLGQAFHRHGLETPQSAMIQLPIMRLPVPPNTRPEKLDYEKFRVILRELVDGLTDAEATLASAKGADVKLTFDLLKVRLDVDGDGRASDYESLGVMTQHLTRSSDPTPSDMTFSFDATDVLWLRGYSQFISAVGQFFLAHDFHLTFDKTFHMFFPRAGLPLASELVQPFNPANMFSDSALGDGVAFIHLLNWPTVEPARLADVRLRLKSMAALSRESWASARAETDNDREWLPNAKQTSAFKSLPTTDETIDGWLTALTEFEAILDGKLLLPHWRFDKGLNVKRIFEESKNFDLVLLIAGADAVPYLETGPVSSSTQWNDLMRVFQGNFLGYALWYN
jgi:hypothetical protein